MSLGFVLQPALLILSGHILYLAGWLSLKIPLFSACFFFFFLCGILIFHNRHLYKEIKGLKANSCFIGKL